MSGLADIVTALADQIRDALSPHQEDIQVEPIFVPEPTPPTIDIHLGDVARDAESAAFDDVSGGYLLTVRARVATADWEAGNWLLIAFADDENDLCIANAILDDPTLGGQTTSVDLRDFSGLREFPHPSGAGSYLGIQFTVLAIPARS